MSGFPDVQIPRFGILVPGNVWIWWIMVKLDLKNSRVEDFSGRGILECGLLGVEIPAFLDVGTLGFVDCRSLETFETWRLSQMGDASSPPFSMYRTPSWSSRFRGCIEKGALEGLRAHVEWTLRFEKGRVRVTAAEPLTHLFLP